MLPIKPFPFLSSYSLLLHRTFTKTMDPKKIEQKRHNQTFVIMITKNQWLNIHTNHLGLRSEDNNSTINGSGASYAMDMGMDFFDPIPDTWETLLRGTIQHMQNYENAPQRYLMIVRDSTGNEAGHEYTGCFPKCSSRATVVLQATSLNQDIDTLIEWVKNNI